MLSIAIDTSIYTADAKRRRPAFRALTRLLKSDLASLAVPFFVKREFVTKQQTIIGDAIKAIASAAGTILDNTNNAEMRAYATQVHDHAKQLHASFSPLIESEFDDWITEVNAEEYPISLEQAEAVVDDYFSGAAPFKSLKHRNDIPDSFIWRALMDVVRDSGQVHFVTNDGALFSAAEAIPQITPYRSLDEFLQTKECQAAIRSLWSKTLEENIERAQTHLAAHEGDFVERITDLLPGEMVAKHIYDELLPTHDHEATIYNLNHINSINISFDDGTYSGATSIGLFFTLNVYCTLEYAVEKIEYHMLPQDDKKHLKVEDRNEYYYGIEDHRTLDARGVLTLKLPDSRLGDIALSDNDIENLITNADYSIEVYEIEIE
jgi:hypothetical protein